ADAFGKGLKVDGELAVLWGELAGVGQQVDYNAFDPLWVLDDRRRSARSCEGEALSLLSEQQPKTIELSPEQAREIEGAKRETALVRFGLREIQDVIDVRDELFGLGADDVEA